MRNDVRKLCNVYGVKEKSESLLLEPHFFNNKHIDPQALFRFRHDSEQETKHCCLKLTYV